MPGVSRCDRGDDTRVLPTHCTRGCGCNGHPAFPTPSKGETFRAKLARMRGEIADAYLAVIARSERDEQSTLPRLRHGLLRGACHRARVRAIRWLAMTI